MPIKRGKKWYTDVTYKYVDGKGIPRQRRIRRSIGRKKEDAVAAEVEIRAQIAAGTFDPNPPRPIVEAMTFANFAMQEFMPWSALHHSPSHHAGQKRTVEKQLIPFFGEVLCLDEIETKQIEDYKQFRCRQRSRCKYWKRQKPISTSTVNRELSCIKTIFRQAVQWGQLKHSPAAGVPVLKEIPNPPDLLSVDQIADLISRININARAAVGIAVYAGLRKMEILRLEWTHVDLKAGVIVAVSREGRTNKSNRDRRIPIAPELEELLREHPRRLGCKYVFPNFDATGHRKEFRIALRSAARRPESRRSPCTSCVTPSALTR